MFFFRYGYYFSTNDEATAADLENRKSMYATGTHQRFMLYSYAVKLHNIYHFN